MRAALVAVAGRDGQDWRKPRFLKIFFLLFRFLRFLVFQVSVRFLGFNVRSSCVNAILHPSKYRILETKNLKT